MVIDWEHHFAPAEIVKRWGDKAGQELIKRGKIGGHMFEQLCDIDKQLEFMDAAGIDIAVFSGTNYSIEDCRLTDGFYAKVMKDHPERIICLAPQRSDRR